MRTSEEKRVRLDPQDKIFGRGRTGLKLFNCDLKKRKNRSRRELQGQSLEETVKNKTFWTVFLMMVSSVV